MPVYPGAFVFCTNNPLTPGPKLVASDETTTPDSSFNGGYFGFSVALSADGNTALIGGPLDADVSHSYQYEGDGYKLGDGAAWVFTRSGSTWTQQGPKLTVSGGNGAPIPSPPNPVTHRVMDARLGISVAPSADGNTALIGASPTCAGGGTVSGACGCWWTPGYPPPGPPNYLHPVSGVPHLPEQGPKLAATDETGTANFGFGVALSGDGTKALIGGPDDNPNDKLGLGAAWVFTRSGTTWAQQGAKLAATDEAGPGAFGWSAALSADGTAALIGGPADNATNGAAWAFTASNGGGPSGGGPGVGVQGGAVQGVTTFVKKPSVVHGSEVTFTVRCARSTCHDRATETLTEKLRGKQIVSVAAATRAQRVIKKTVTVASAAITMAAGATRKVTLRLSATGRALLARLGKLPIHLTISQRMSDGRLIVLESVKLTVKRAPAKKHRE